MKRYITHNGKTYLIRGPWTVGELKKQYGSFVEKYHGSKMSFSEWLVNRGKVYCTVNKKETVKI